MQYDFVFLGPWGMPGGHVGMGVHASGLDGWNVYICTYLYVYIETETM